MDNDKFTLIYLPDKADQKLTYNIERVVYLYE